MDTRQLPALYPVLAAIPDPRSRQGRRHPLPAILALACTAMLANGNSLLAIAEWGRDEGALVARRLGFTRDQTPCVATLHRVMRRVDVAAFEQAVGAWVAPVQAALAAA